MKKTKPDPVALKTTFSAGRVYISRQSAALYLARMKGVDLPPHEGFMRQNDGDWLLCIQYPDGERNGFATIRAVAESKRGQGYVTPDPEGQANAFEVVRRWNAFPDLLETLTVICCQATGTPAAKLAQEALERTMAPVVPDLR